MNAKAEVKIRRHGGQQKCDVVVDLSGRQMIVTVPDYDRALKWARMECKSYGIADALSIAEVFEPIQFTAAPSTNQFLDHVISTTEEEGDVNRRLGSIGEGGQRPILDRHDHSNDTQNRAGRTE